MKVAKCKSWSRFPTETLTQAFLLLLLAPRACCRLRLLRLEQLKQRALKRGAGESDGDAAGPSDLLPAAALDEAGVGPGSGAQQLVDIPIQALAKKRRVMDTVAALAASGGSDGSDESDDGGVDQLLDWRAKTVR